MSEIIQVTTSKSGKAKVKLFGETHTVQLDDNNRTELSLYGQTYIIVAKAKQPKASTSNVKPENTQSQ